MLAGVFYTTQPSLPHSVLPLLKVFMLCPFLFGCSKLAFSLSFLFCFALNGLWLEEGCSNAALLEPLATVHGRTEFLSVQKFVN